MKVAFSGASGSGKTTLVKFINNNPHWDLPWVNGSSGQLKTPEENKSLADRGLGVSFGHRKVIQTGHANPYVGIDNQLMILKARTKFIKENPRFVTDRSPLDNWVYYLTQCSMYDEQKQSLKFLKLCHEAAKHLTHIIVIPSMFEVENNDSRITNFWYQHMITTLFIQTLQEFRQHAEIEDWPTKFLILETKNLETRKLKVTEFLNG